MLAACRVYSLCCQKRSHLGKINLGKNMFDKFKLLAPSSLQTRKQMFSNRNARLGEYRCNASNGTPPNSPSSSWDEEIIDVESFEKMPIDAGNPKIPSTQPGWFDEEQIDVHTDRELASLLAAILQQRYPLPALLGQRDLKLSAFLALLVAAGKARHWQAAKDLYNYMLDATTHELETLFYLHLAEKRMEDEQHMAALEVFIWLKDTRRPPSSQALQLFSQLARRVSEKDAMSEEYEIVYRWFEYSDAGRALWDVFMGNDGPKQTGTFNMDADPNNFPI